MHIEISVLQFRTIPQLSKICCFLLVELGSYQSCWYRREILQDEDKMGYQMAQILNVPDDYELVCFLSEFGIPERRNIFA